MISLPGFRIKEEIHSGENCVVFRAEKSSKPVTIKLFRKEYPEPKELNSFKYEYEVLEKIHSKGITSPIGLEKYKNSLAIIFEDIGGEDLTKLFKDTNSKSLDQILKIFLLSVKALGEIHKLKIVHKDIKPHNIVFNNSTSELQIIDFGSSSYLSKQSSFTPLNSSIEGTLAYISPEQSGRMNRTVDYRTDYYSLGVTFYQLLTDELPFQYSDPMELVHAHIAKTPISPFDKNGTPKVVSDIIMKLLQKNPEDRYQSTIGIEFDLEWCLSQLRTATETHNPTPNNDIDFKIGTHDFSGKFQIPEKLYGRTKEIVKIMKTFKKVTEGNTELLLISGRSGIGKSVLINEVNKPITEYKGYFASGKYDPFKRSIPYRALAYAFQNLLKQILTENPDSIFLWKLKLLNALGSNGKIIIDVIPELEALIGEQPLVEELSLTESQNRFNLVFQNFIKTICSKEHPVVIFLDDLQWADIPSINLIQNIMMNSETKYLFLMLSFRDNEVFPTDAFSIMLEELKKNGIQYKEIVLNPISLLDTSQLVKDTMDYDEDEAYKIASILFDKTKGNPFFVNEVFKSFYEKDLIEYKDGKWNCDFKKIQEVKISENVIDLMVSKIQELPIEAISNLKLAACIGSWFQQDVFAKILGQYESTVKESLIYIANEGFLRLGETDVNFIHDKIKEAAYSLLSPEDKSRNHHKIGNAILNSIDKNELDEFIFTIVGHLNLGMTWEISESKKSELLELNISAGKKAMQSSAFDSAFSFFKIAIELLPSNSWETDYEKTLQLYTIYSRANYLNKNYADTEKTLDSILEKAKTVLDKVSIYEIKIRMYYAMNRMQDALDILFIVLKLLDVSIPRKPSELSVLPELLKFKFKMRNKKIQDLYNLPEMKDEKSIAILRLLDTSVPIAYVSEPNLLPIMILKMVNLSIDNGNHNLSIVSYVTLGIILGSALGNFENGFESGDLALRLLDKYKSTNIRCTVYFRFAFFVDPWKNHIRKTQEYFQTAMISGLETGDLLNTAYSITNSNVYLILQKENLEKILANYIKYQPKMENLKQMGESLVNSMHHQMVLNLLGKSNDILFLTGEIWNEEKNFPLIKKEQMTATFFFYTYKSILNYFFGSVEVAFEFDKKASILEKSGLGSIFIAEHIFFSSLICIKLYLSTMNKNSKREYLKRLKQNYKRLKVWSENCIENFLHKFHIVEGLIHLTNQKPMNAISSFQKAISSAAKESFTLEEAIANELSAEVWFQEERISYANLHLKEAYFLYNKWGCIPKLKQLEEKYPQLKFHSTRQSSDLSSISTSIQTTTANSSFLDLNTVVKSSQTISSEIHLGKLLEKLMKILFENAGAERGFFILKEKEKFYIEAEGNANIGAIEVLKKKPLDGYTELSPNIVNFVVRTKSFLILNDASKKGIFVNDLYVKEKLPKSILCYPIINQGNLIGVVYLENNLTTDAFTPDRIEILKILSSQIAVSVENSLLYTNLEEKVIERTKDLNIALVEVRALKEQQDGDYFLNTLLIEPLGQNNAQSKKIEIEFFIKQNKKFMFRKKEYELGGDINISENIELQGKKYIVFLNGDAMGKSIQGAGGVLVLGTVFKSIIQRTISTSMARNMYPERWLKNAFIEMHKAFESFDGTMLMSTVFGLVDEQTGTMYFMNAEHPDIVLYRDEYASFVENPNRYRKLGTQGLEGNLSVEVFPLKPDDIIILGSDGKDDIILGKDKQSGYDIINHDENLFLKHVKRAEANLEKIFREIQFTGKQMDDLSLFKIHYKGAPIDQTVLDENLKQLDEYKEKKQFQKYTEFAATVIDDYPYLTNVIYETSIAFKELKQFENAIDFGERVRLRESKNFLNLLNLIESYDQAGKKERAKSILEACLKLKPNDERFLQLKSEVMGYPHKIGVGEDIIELDDSADLYSLP